ncbi:MAG TPA: ABC transporter permease, partial [Acetobacteraceae bacterium]|nr:ABC transporter permease [Acetobacteraceae bacterium]
MLLLQRAKQETDLCMRFELFVASRYLRAKRRQAVVGVITVISIIGVAAGVASLILALAITNGMQRDLQKQLLGSTAQVELMRVASDGIENWRPLVQRLRHLPHVTAAAPGLYGQVLISRGARSGGALIKGILPADERTVSNLLNNIKQGSAATLAPVPATNPNGSSSAPPPLVLGSDLADQIGAGVGDTVLVTSPQGELTPFGLVPKYERFQVVAIFHSGFYQYDSSFALARLTDVQHLFGEPNIVSVIGFKVDDLYHADRIGHEIEQAAGKGFMTTNWMEQNRELFRALRLEQVVTFIVIGLIVCVAALNILIALTMMVMEKTRDIAVLMSYGVRPSQVRRIFVWQGMLIGILGTTIGLVLGYALAWFGGHYRIIHLSAAVY